MFQTEEMFWKDMPAHRTKYCSFIQFFILSLAPQIVACLEFIALKQIKAGLWLFQQSTGKA